MIHEHLELHNVVELEQRPHLPGLQMQRIPRHVRDTLNPRGRWRAQATPGSEIRVVTDAPHVRLFISATEGDADLLVFRGDWLVSRHYLQPDGITCIHVVPPERFKEVKDEALRVGRFSPDVWRFMLAGYCAAFHELDTFGYDHRPPEADEKPALRWLAYGSSITIGSGASRPDLCYPQQAARRLGVDVMNMGMGGACMCEPALADFFAQGVDWDFATLEIGVNMYGQFSPAEFQQRATYMVDTMRAHNPGKPIVLITPVANRAHFAAAPTDMVRDQTAYESILRELATARADQGVHLIEGRDMLPDLTGLGADLVHPNDFGYILMSENLARRLSAIVG